MYFYYREQIVKLLNSSVYGESAFEALEILFISHVCIMCELE
jgi:hypothetical protein